MKIHILIIEGEVCISGKLFMHRSGLNASTFTMLVRCKQIHYKTKGIHKYYPSSQLSQFGGK